MNQQPQPPATPNQGESPESANFMIDMSFLADGFRALGQENKKIMAELVKFRDMYNANQKLSEELKKYRDGALRQSQESLLRAIAQIYIQYKKDTQNSEVLRFILTALKGVLEDNEVQFVKSSPGTPFVRQHMKIEAEFVVITDEEKKDRTVAESLEPGYFFFGEPLIQELVKIYKYEATGENDKESADLSELNDLTTESTTFSEENVTPRPEGDAETTSESQDEIIQEQNNVKVGASENEEQ